MVVIKNENTDFYDVDGTIIIHESHKTIPPGESLQVFDAVTKQFITVRINKPMVRLLRESKARGSYVVVWSRGGYRWAADVIKALELTEYVDLVISKPLAYFDDTPIEKWLPYRVFIEPGVIYKQLNKEPKQPKGESKWLLKK